MATEYTGINYFPLQAGFFEGNLQELLEAKYGIKGPYLVLQLLCKIYKEGYYLQWGEEQTMIFAHKLGREYAQEEVKEMIEILLEKGFFDKESYEKHQILTSEGIQRVWIEATNRRKRDLTKLPYLLIEITDSKEANQPASTKANKCKQKETSSEQDVDIFATQTQLNEENADIFRQIKEKKIKELPPLYSPPGDEDDERGRFSFASSTGIRPQPQDAQLLRATGKLATAQRHRYRGDQIHHPAIELW